MSKTFKFCIPRIKNFIIRLTIVYITTSLIKIITYLLVLSLQWTCKKCGLVTSAILLLFWTLAALTGTFTFISVLQSGHLSGKFLRLLEYILG